MKVINVFLLLLIRFTPVRILDLLLNLSWPTSEPGLILISRLKPDIFEILSRRKLNAAFRRSCLKVPAYRDFLEEHPGKIGDISGIGDIIDKVPQTTKQNYINRYPLDKRCVGGKLPGRGFIEESAGTSGGHTNWIRSCSEEVDNISMVRATMSYLYNFNRGSKVIVLNCFMLGGWSGGLKYASRIGGMGIVKNVGNSPEKVIETLDEFGPDNRYLIGGYPPFITELILYGEERDGFDWREYSVDLFAGGEGFMEEWRVFISSRLKEGALIFSDYGAIDLDAGISIETPFTISIRKIINKDENFRKILFSSDRIPCFIGQYSPHRFFINESTRDDRRKELEITPLNLKSSTPMIKYLIGDEGGIIEFNKVINSLALSGYKICDFKKEYNVPLIMPFPLIYLFGRIDGIVTINGTMISPNEISKAILSDDTLIRRISSFRLGIKLEEKFREKLLIQIEARKDIILSDHLLQLCRESLVSGLLASNECFRINYEKNPDSVRPLIEIFPFNSGLFMKTGSMVKNIYIL